MNFSVKEWRKMYDEVHRLGAILKDARPTFTQEQQYIPPKSWLNKEAKDDLECEISMLLKRSDQYLDQCGMKKPAPLWHYDKKNVKTWLSHESFEYLNCIKF